MLPDHLEGTVPVDLLGPGRELADAVLHAEGHALDGQAAPNALPQDGQALAGVGLR